MEHKKLEAWQVAIKLVKEVYVLSKQLPKDEQFGLISQMRRSAISIPSNIAEGSARNSDKEMTQFLYISLGSLAELETQIIIANELKFINESVEVSDLIGSEKKLILGLIKYLKNKKGTK